MAVSYYNFTQMRFLKFRWPFSNGSVSVLSSPKSVAFSMPVQNAFETSFESHRFISVFRRVEVDDRRKRLKHIKQSTFPDDGALLSLSLHSLHGWPGWQGFRDLGFFNRDLGKRARNFAIWTPHPGRKIIQCIFVIERTLPSHHFSFLR